MKKIKSILLFVILMLCLFPSYAQKTKITIEQLPNEAQMFLAKNFKAQDIDYIIMDNELSYKDYTVRYKNGIIIEFNKKGEWKEIEGNPIPTSILPNTIIDYLAINYKEATIVKVEKYKKYELKLSNGLELLFNSKGEFIRIGS